VGCGITTIATLKRLAGEGKGEMLGSTLPIRNLPYVHPDYSLESVLRHVYHEPLVPGGPSRADFRRLEGVISLEDVLEKYEDVLEKYKEREAATFRDICPDVATACGNPALWVGPE
jgi:hypothetical protein